MCNLNPKPLAALYGTSGDENPQMTPTERHAVSFSLLLARQAILLRWKALPTHTQWLWDMHCLTLEKVKFSLTGSQDTFHKTWLPFLICVQVFHTTSVITWYGKYFEPLTFLTFKILISTSLPITSPGLPKYKIRGMDPSLRQVSQKGRVCCVCFWFVYLFIHSFFFFFFGTLQQTFACPLRAGK